MRKQSDSTKLKHVKRELVQIKKDRDQWKLSAETWKKAFNELVEKLKK